ncbi:MAG: hypothetical protein MRZ41_06640, partial [Eubacterium sp.]|nr:hypothetical protein [Eubacterium sp.]
MRLEMGELTKRDKKLLILLGIILVVTGFVFLAIKPLAVRLKETKANLEKEEELREINQKKISLYSDLADYDDALHKKIEKNVEDFYEMMTSEEIDRMLTDMALGYHLEARNLDIQIPEEEEELEPYVFSEAAANKLENDSGYESISGAAGMYDVEAMMEEKSMLSEDAKDTQEEETEAIEEDTLTFGIHTAQISMQLSGSEENLKAMLENLLKKNKSLRLTGYSFDR